MRTQNKRQYQKGDEVRFLNDVGGGLVKRIRTDGMVLVETEDGFDYPMPADELVLIKPATGTTAGDPIVTTERNVDEMRVVETSSDKKILLGFVRNTTDNGVVLSLINDTSWFFSFALYSQVDENSFRLIVQDVLEPDTKIEIGEFADNELDDLRNIAIQGFFSGDKMKELRSLVEAKVKSKMVNLKLGKNFKKTPYFVDPSHIVEVYNSSKELTKERVEELIDEKDNQDIIDLNKGHRSKKRPSPIIREEDLHINVLVESVVGMSNTAILNYQMAHFRKTLDKGIVDNVENVIFIHGIGNGTLKATLRDSLENEYHLFYEDASFKEYGFGATRVFPNRKTHN